jgi:serine/threonine protein kinase
MLLQNPQPYYKHACWIILSLAKAVAQMHENGVYHLGLNPDSILVFHDEAGIPRPVLVDLGMAADGELAADPAQLHPEYGVSAYLAPEVSFDRQGDRRTDVYGLGLLLYLLLSGRAPRPAQWRPPRLEKLSDQTAFKLDREDLSVPLNELVRQAISHQESSRPENVVDFASRLREILGEDVPPLKTDRRISWRSLLLVAGLVILLLALVALAVVLNEAGG